MADQTGVDPDAVRDSANRIGAIFSSDDLLLFNNLSSHGQSAGTFVTAQWLNGIVNDRITAVQEQAQIIQTTLQDISTQLMTVANDLENTDTDNANQLATDIGNLETQVGKDTASIGSTSSTTGSATPRLTEDLNTGSGSGTDTGGGSDTQTGGDSGTETPRLYLSASPGDPGTPASDGSGDTDVDSNGDGEASGATPGTL